MTTFEAEYRRLNSAQRQAVDAIDGPLLVVAGPGTGKTQLLSMRVANILRKTDVSPNSILCLTYTESGKQAMISRLEQLLGDVSKRVEVHTFHGFGSRLITRFQDYFPELANFRPAEDLTLYETLYASLVRLPRSNPLSKQAYGQFTYQTDARDRISLLKRAGITPERALQKAEADNNWCKSTGKRLAKIFNETGRLSSKALPRLSADLEPLLDASQKSELGQLCLEELRDALQEAYAAEKTTPLSNFKKKWFVAEEGTLYFRPADQLKKLLALAELYGIYETELKQRNLFDYDDMILYALEKLENNKEFLSVVQETFQYILADEYQDTNAAQARILNLIADNPVNEGRPNVMVVGDDDQAIYGFQGALGDVLMDFRERWQDVRVVILKNNYRSTQAIIEASRAVIVHGQNRLENYYEDIDKSLRSNTNYLNVAPRQFEGAAREAIIDKAVQVAKISGHEKQLAIIATKHKYLRELADRLDKAKIGYYYEGREDLLSDPAIQKLLLVAEAALAIRKKEFVRTNYVLPEMIATQLVNVPKAVAWQIALQAKAQKKSWWEVMNASKDDAAKKAAKVLKESASFIEPQDAKASLRALAVFFKWRLTRKAARLHDHAVSYYGRSELSVRELINYTVLCKQAGVALEQTVVKGNEDAQVILLSAHKSKGLEFDRVFILHADYNTWFKERGRRNNLSLPEGWKHLEPLATTTDDKLRLLYVVMTRAKQELTLLKSKEGGENLPGFENIKAEDHIAEQLQAFDVPHEKTWHDWYLPQSAAQQKELRHIFKPVLQNYRLSATHLTAFLDVVRGGPQRFFVNVLLGIPEPVHVEALFGSHVHKTLRFAQNHLTKSKKLPGLTAIKRFVKDNISGLNDSQIQDIAEVVDGFLQHTSFLEPGGVAEYNFASDNISLLHVRLTGIVDNFINKNGVLTITDFKTGRALNSWAVREDYYKQKLHRFRQQLLFYELLFHLKQDFDDSTRFTSRIAFVEPSKRDVYYELVLDASSEERNKLESLIGAVWQHIIDLDFPSTEAYSLDFSGISQLEEDLASGAI